MVAETLYSSPIIANDEETQRQMKSIIKSINSMQLMLDQNFASMDELKGKTY